MKRVIQKYFGRYTVMVLVGCIYMLPLMFVHAAFDAFLKIEGVPGESTDLKFKGAIDIQSWSWGMSQRVTGSGANRVIGPLEKQEFTVTKWIDKSSPILMLGACAGTSYPKMEFIVENRASTSKTTKVTYTMQDCIISTYTVAPGGGSTGGESVPTESISLNFSKIEIHYSEEDAATGIITNEVSGSCESEPDGAL